VGFAIVAIGLFIGFTPLEPQVLSERLLKKLERASFEFEARSSKAVERRQSKRFDEHDDGGMMSVRGQEHIEAAGVAGAADGACLTRRFETILPWK